MDNIRRPVPVSVPLQVSLSNEEVDRIVLKRLQEMAHGIRVCSNGSIEYQGYTEAPNEAHVMTFQHVRDAPRLHEIYVSYLAYRLESALRDGPLKTRINSGAGLIDY
jgi:hypothetical protein